MNNFSIKDVLKKNVMAIALFVIYIFFTVMTGGNMFTSSNVASLIDQNAYVFILGVGMLMCMLTGGNIDLSVGSFVCFMGAVVGIFSVSNKLFATPLQVPVAYMRIPPWIATLAGYLAFRGLGTQILITASETSAISNFPPEFLGIFSGKIFESGYDTMNIPCIVLGVIGAAAVIILNLTGRAKKVAKGYQADPLAYTIVKSVLVAAIIMVIAYQLSWDGGLPVVVLWIAAVLIIYRIINKYYLPCCK